MSTCNVIKFTTVIKAIESEIVITPIKICCLSIVLTLHAMLTSKKLCFENENESANKVSLLLFAKVVGW